MKKIILNLILTILAFILTGLGTSMSIKASIGISSFNAMNVSLSNLFHLKIGTITTLANLLFLFLYIIITKGKFILKYILQFIGVYFIGIVINFFTYSIFNNFKINNYFISLILLVTGIIIGGISVGLMLCLDTMSFPIEAFCLEYSEKFKKSFSKIRRNIDIIAIIISLFISYVFTFPFLIREGTILSLVIFATTIGYSHKFFNKFENLKNLKLFV